MKIEKLDERRKLWEIGEVLLRNGGPIPMSKAGIYKAASEGKIPVVRIGRRVLIPDWYIQRITSEC